jgi:hypothetical protein
VAKLKPRELTAPIAVVEEVASVADAKLETGVVVFVRTSIGLWLGAPVGFKLELLELV